MNIVITNDEEAKDFVLNTTDSSIAMHLACFEIQGISKDKIVDMCLNATLHIHKLITEAGFEDDGINVNNCISMMIFSSAIKAYFDLVDKIAKDNGVDREILLNEIKINELALLKANMKN